MRYSDAIATRFQTAATAALRSAEILVSKRQPELSDIRNFALLQHPLALGTAIHATPLIAALHASVPDARIAAVASGFALEILKGNPGLERLISAPSPLQDLRGSVRALRANRLFEGEPYAVLQTLGNERSKLTIAAMFAGGHTRIGFAVLAELNAAHLSFEPHLSQIDNNLRIIGPLGHGAELEAALAANHDLKEPQVFPSASDKSEAHALLAEHGIDAARPISIFVTQTSPTQRKSWRTERFQAAARYLHEKYGMQIVFAGTNAERAAIEALQAGLAFATANVAGRTSLLALAALMGNADIALTLDTGPMHLARAMRLPMVVIAPAWSPAIEWLPLESPRARVLKNADLPSAPTDYVIDEVSVEEVLQNLDELLELYPPRGRTC